jgi:hypothetical protein
MSICAGIVSVRAEDTLEQKMRGMDAPGNGGMYFAQNSTSASFMQVPGPSEPKGNFSDLPSGFTPAASAAAQAKMDEMMKANPPVPAAESKPAVADKPADASYPGKQLGMKPILAPALPISPEKAGKLAALLAKYKADQVTPEDYQKQRAEIISAP